MTKSSPKSLTNSHIYVNEWHKKEKKRTSSNCFNKKSHMFLIIVAAHV